MGPLLNDWILARMMSAPKADDSVIYKLQNYVCDGTANTAINTGLYLLDTNLYPNDWQITLDFTINAGNGSNASYLRCRNSVSPYNGFTVRRDGGNANNIGAQLNNIARTTYAPPGTRNVVIIQKKGSKINMTINDNVYFEAGLATCISPLVIGGELSNDTSQQWNPNRFSKIIIHSLIITKL